MTDTEAKALALELDRIANQLYAGDPRPTIAQAVLYIHSTIGAEARHAAEMRELKERFSEVAGRAVKHMARTCFAAKGSPRQLEREAVVAGLTDFILPAPDPLVEAMKEVEPMTPWEPQDASQLRAAMQARGYEWRKIGEAGE